MKHLYLSNWPYNAAHIFDELEKIVLNHGGAIVSTWRNTAREKVSITNRTLNGAIREEKERIERLENLGRPADHCKRDLERLEAINNEPYITAYGDWQYISFVVNGMYYYYQVDRNPFFPFYYTKTPVTGGEIDRNAWSYEDKKEWLYDCFFRVDCSQADRVEAANLIFNMLVNSSVSGKHKPARPAKLYVLTGEI